MPNLDYLFKPKSVAVIGASTKPNTIGKVLFNNILSYEFNGLVFPIHPKATNMNGLKCYKSVLDVPDNIDTGIIIVPREQVLVTIDECGKKGIKSLVIITAGFKEIGKEGLELENKVVQKCKEYNIRFIGPNSMGIFNAEPSIRLNATFASHHPITGNIGFISQSGALGQVILEYAKDLGLGFYMFASIGNNADISTVDLLEYWEQEPNIKLILLYIESIDNVDKFRELSTRITKSKPIIALKAGRTEAGALAASSHTGALASGDVPIDALLKQCGIIRVDTLEELFELSQIFVNQRIPQGKRVAILTNAGGPGILGTDASIVNSLEVPRFTQNTNNYLRSILRPEASIQNPVDMIASATAENYYKCTSALLKDPNIDMGLIIFVPPIMVDAKEVAQSIVKAANEVNKPLAVSYMGLKEKDSIYNIFRENRIAVYAYPESAAKSLSKLYNYFKWQSIEIGEIKKYKGNKDLVKTTIENVYKENRTYLYFKEVVDILNAYEINIAPTLFANSLDEVITVGEKIGYPLVLKLDSVKVIHKSDIGGVIVNIQNKEALINAYNKIQNIANSLDTSPTVAVQKMVKGGIETIIGVNTDSLIGKIIMFGLGGIYVEVLKDINFKVCPLTEHDIKEIVSSIKSYDLLKGIRGQKGVDLNAIYDTIGKISSLVSDFEEIKELDINPFLAKENYNDSVIIDARIKLKD